MTKLSSPLLHWLAPENWGRARVIVAGDIMLDRFVSGTVRRQSPEAPVPVLEIEKTIETAGGASNVAANLSALGIPCLIAGIAGQDDAGATIEKLLAQTCDTLIRTDMARPTIVKTRFMTGGKHLLRADNEKIVPLPPSLRHNILDALKEQLKDARVLVLSDYAKGFLAAGMAQSLIALARAAGLKILADPKGHDFTIYRGADIITPNRAELAQATGITARSDGEIIAAAQKLRDMTGIDTVVVTRSEDGLSVITKDAPPLHLPAQAKIVRDVSGAGDSVIAALAACIAAGASIHDAARIAATAAAISVEQPGTACVKIDTLRERLSKPPVKTQLLSDAPASNDVGAQAQDVVRLWQQQGLRVGFTNGCFDILHLGHVNYLAAARAECDRLVVGLNSDASIKRLKGKDRPVNNAESRQAVMAALASVDLVVMFGDDPTEGDTPCNLVAALRPDVFFKGGDYTEDRLPEAKIVRSYGGNVRIMSLHEGYSTTASIKKMTGNG